MRGRRREAPAGVRPQEERSDGTERTRRTLSVASSSAFTGSFRVQPRRAWAGAAVRSSAPLEAVLWRD